ncbi:MAG: hypothetical protein J7623_01320 [Chitinophaga sp.]|uniref:hypothetical protein n=1 Tax=Chitinophaga sp. TaxID=1869181 RepID=UPI001B0D8067|nr:hypothetical protein [Chitinophaga sp.]MBO9727254.1 hypothetical protein [Chitinophaga sp.]
MTNSEELYDIKRCLLLAEDRLNRGSADAWSSYDFEALSIAIATDTGVTLSVTTLKRLWGKLKYAHIPTTTTLNTLAQFVGYKDWRDFKNQTAPPGKLNTTRLEPQPPIHNTALISPEKIPAKRISRKWAWGLLLLLPFLVYGLLSLNNRSTAPVDPSAYIFRCDKIRRSGVPNSVIFHYRALAATDTVFIAQSWDVSRKTAVPIDKTEHSSIYYTPGYFRAKLMVGQQIVKEDDLMIASDGWVTLIENESGAPLYFKKDEVERNETISVDEALLSQYHLPLQPSPPALRFFNVQDMGALKNDQFVFETTLKSDFHRGSAACQNVQVLILCKNDVIIVPLCAKGCVGDIFLYAAGRDVSSKQADLSGFGCDLDQWATLRVEAKNKQMRFIVNGQTAYTLTLPHTPTDIVGLQYRFSGTGAIKDTRFINGNQVIPL